MQVAVGSILEGKVAKITNYGAFVDLEGGGSGMVHISEVANTYVKDINDYLKVGDAVKVKVIGVNPENKVSLSIKATIEAPPPQQRPPRPQAGFRRGKQPASTGDPFEDMMNSFKRSSDDRMSDLKKVIDTRRGSQNRKAHK